MPRKRGIMTGSRVAVVGRLSQFFGKAKITKRIVLRLESVEPI